jgi:mannose-1-phosphate guanylyltransferase / mannose-6-phosphate isomerase
VHYCTLTSVHLRGILWISYSPMTALIPVILSGGSGTRLWPLSRKSYPKQFVPLMGHQSLFQLALHRLSGDLFAAPLIITNSDFRFIVTEQVTGSGIDPRAILIEPEGRNTAPAILAAALYLVADDPDALILITPSDHVMPDWSGFHAAINAAIPSAKAGRIVTFGITPDRAETGYGWLELAAVAQFGPVDLLAFVEKPGAAVAAEMLASGRYLWNAGIYLAAASSLIKAFQTHAPHLLAPVAAAVQNATPDLGFLRLAPGPWQEAKSISIDYAVMEHVPDLVVMPLAQGWSDLGDWDAVGRESTADDQGNIHYGHAHAMDCTDSILRAEDAGMALVGIGLDNIIAIAMPDAVLVADRRRAQDVRLAVTMLKENHHPQAETFPRDHRPWGWFDRLVTGDGFQVKRIVVHPGAALSLQSHLHRAEHWIVVSGAALVTLDGTQTTVQQNQSIYIPQGAKHRLQNQGPLPMVLIEVQTGTYFGEDDITRYEDLYARGPGAKG